MKHLTLLLLLPVCLTGQTPTADPAAPIAVQNVRSKFNCWVKFNAPRRTVQGIFMGATDSTVTFASRLFTPSAWSTEYEVRVIPAVEIQTISFRKRGSMAIGTAIGLGAAVGASVVLSDRSNGGVTRESVTLGTIAFGLPSALIGTLIGSVKQKYPIEGRQENLARVRPKLALYLRKPKNSG